MKTIHALALLLAGAGAACSKGSAAPPMAPLPPAISVTTEVVAPRPMPRALAVTGSLVANQRADVAANVSGKILKTFVERGSIVAEGAPLVQIDATNASLGASEANAMVETARATEALAKAQCERNANLFEKGVISRDEWDRISSACRTTAGSARAAGVRVEVARKQIADTTVRAPFTGLVAERFVNVGEYLQPMTKVVTLVEIDPLRLQLTVSEVDLGWAREGQPVSFSVQAFPGALFTGTVKYVGPSVRENTRDLVIEAIVPNAERKLRPGMFANADLGLPDLPTPSVPKTALRPQGATMHIFLVVDGKIEERVVQTGVERSGYVAVIDGLKGGETIVIDPGANVKDGTPVTGAAAAEPPPADVKTAKEGK